MGHFCESALPQQSHNVTPRQQMPTRHAPLTQQGLIIPVQGFEKDLLMTCNTTGVTGAMDVSIVYCTAVGQPRVVEPAVKRTGQSPVRKAFE